MDYIKSHNFSTVAVNDAHCHASRMYPVKKTVENFKHITSFYNIDKFVVLGLEDDEFSIKPNLMAEALYIKEQLPYRCYALAPLLHQGKDWTDVDGCLRQAQRATELGFDGMKMMEGKPEYYFKEDCNRPLNDYRYELMYEYLEKNDIPLVMHVGNYLSPYNDMLLDQIEDSLKKFPRLRLTLAHFGNMANNYERLCRMLDAYPNLMIDLAIGGDFIYVFSLNHDKWKEFFIKYQDRVLYGTDTYNQDFEEESCETDSATRPSCIRGLFESDKPYYPRCYQNQKSLFVFDEIAVKPINDLPDEVINKIYRTNLTARYGKEPKPVNRDKALEFARDMLAKYESGEMRSYVWADLPFYFSDEEKKNLGIINELSIDNLREVVEYFEEK